MNIIPLLLLVAQFTLPDPPSNFPYDPAPELFIGNYKMTLDCEDISHGIGIVRGISDAMFLHVSTHEDLAPSPENALAYYMAVQAMQAEKVLKLMKSTHCKES